MTPTEFKRWLNAQLREIEPHIGEPPTSVYSETVATAKAYAYLLGLHEFALSLPDSELGKTPLTAANQLRRCLAALETPPADDGSLLSLSDAARILGYKAEGLRKIVKRGEIQFLQNGSGPIKFRREWLDDFIEGNARRDVANRSPAQKRTLPSIEIEPQFGFDPALYSR